MKVTYCAWCDRPAQHKRREDGARDNSEACCDEHFMLYFGEHTLLFQNRIVWDLPTLAGPGARIGWHRRGRHVYVPPGGAPRYKGERTRARCITWWRDPQGLLKDHSVCPLHTPRLYARVAEHRVDA